MSKIKKMDFEKASQLSLEECVRSRLSKIKKNHPELSEKEQEKLAKQRCETRPKEDFTLDYPVQGHIRSGKPVKTHERGVSPKKEILAKVEKIKKIREKYSGRLIKTTKSGKRYIEFAPIDNVQGGTERAIRVNGIWLPKSQVITDDKKGGYVYVAEWLFNEKQRELVLNEIGNLNKFIQKEKENIRKEKELIETPKKFSSITKEDRERNIKNYNKSIKKLEIRIKFQEELLQTFDSILDFSLIPIISKVISKTITSVIVRIDSIPFSEFIQLKTDFETTDFVVFHGPIARDGPYLYQDKNGRAITLHKKLPNLIDIYSRYDYLPIRPSIDIGAHYAEEMGYGTNFCLNEETNMIEADLVLVNDDKFKEILKNQGEYHVSPGYTDIVKNNVQTITGLDHIAIAFGEEMSRACTGFNEKGSSCTKVKQKYHDQNLINGGVINN